MKGQLQQIKIDKKVTEQFLMEQCLNLASSERDPLILLAFYAFANHWHVDKLLYYKDLIDFASYGRKANK